MSSRALRKAQKERERKQLESAHEDEVSDDDETQEEPGAAPKSSMFAMLDMDEGEEQDEHEKDAELEDTVQKQTDGIADLDVGSAEEEDASSELEKSEQQHKDTKKPKKSKNKKKTKKSSASTKSTVDDFLKDIAQPANTPSDDSTSNDLCNLLAIDVQHLQVANEMRRLFGRAAFHEDEHQSASEQRRPREGEGASLADAVTGKMAYGGPGLPAMLRRRNLFAQGKEDWPRATGGGLGMETVEARSNGVTEYRFVHNAGYQHAQREFENCVLGMDPNSMVHLLRFNPYHVSTLLQVSEIAKQEKDYATTGLLLERALFSFGRALPTSFAAKLAQGKARLDFRRPENREFWLTVWRYIANIGMRATWRTAYEWARLLLALDPEGDHYCMCLIIDQYALRAHQAGNFLALTKSRYFADKWRHLPNIRFSASLAAKMGGADASTCEKTLAEVMQQYPWVTARLLQELSIDKIPPSIWGITPSSEKDTLYTELYATLAKDLWKAPEALSFLTRSCAALSSTGGGGGGSTTTAAPNPPNTEPISIDEARHVLLTDRPALIALVPRSITSTVDSMSDPLPPTDNLPSYTVLSRRVAQQRNTAISLNDDDEDDEEGAAAAPEDLIATNPRQFITELDELQRFFEYIIPGVAQPVGGGGGGEGGYNQDGGDAPRDISDEIVEQAMVRASMPIGQLRQRMTRFVRLREALLAQPGQVVRSEGGDRISVEPNSEVRVVLGARGDEEDGEGGEDVYNVPGAFTRE